MCSWSEDGYVCCCGFESFIQFLLKSLVNYSCSTFSTILFYGQHLNMWPKYNMNGEWKQKNGHMLIYYCKIISCKRGKPYHKFSGTLAIPRPSTLTGIMVMVPNSVTHPFVPSTTIPSNCAPSDFGVCTDVVMWSHEDSNQGFCQRRLIEKPWPEFSIPT